MNKTCVLLVAGKGTRLRPYTITKHKCLTEVNGVPILFNALEQLSRAGFEKTVLVVGYKAEQIQEAAGDEYGGMKLEYVRNPRYEETNTSCSLLLGLEAARGADIVAVVEGDVFFEYAVMEELMAQQEPNATVLEPWQEGLEGTFVELDRNGFVSAWTHKSRQGADYDLTDKYKTVNLHRFQWDFVAETLLPYLQSSFRNNNGTEPLEYVMDRIVRAKPNSVFGYVLRGEKWYEIDDESDLRRAESIFPCMPASARTLDLQKG